jgi:hypothetical protein
MPHKATPGVPLVVKAGEYNDAMEAGQWFKQSRQLGAASPGLVLPVNPCTVKIRNDVGSDLAAGSVVELSSSLLTTLDRQHLWLAGVQRTANDPTCAILLEDIPDGSIGVAQVTGVCLASVDVNDEDNTHARFAAGSNTLEGDFGGWARILWKPSGTGVKQCVVQIPSDGVNIVRQATASGTITTGSSGTANIYVNGASRGTVTVWNDWIATPANIGNATELYVQYFHDLDKWRVVGAECV